MDKFTRKTSFTQWLAPINQTLFDNQVQDLHLDYYTKKLYMKAFMPLLLYAQLHETDSLRAISDAMFANELQQAYRLDYISFSQLGRRRSQVGTSCSQSLLHDLGKRIHKETNYQQRRETTVTLNI